ncbi:MAG: transcription-repair coupling factor [Burkholderiales bacterium]|nr:transcription-repair coupling factor [Anaerolineae bacterium]
MQLSGLLDLLRENRVYQQLLEALRTGAPVGSLGLLRSARPFVLAALAQDWPAPVILMTARVNRAYNVSEQLPVWLGANAPIYRFAEPTALFYERAPWGDTTIASRIETLAALLDDSQTAATNPVIVTSARAVMQRTLPVSEFRKASITLEIGGRWQLDRLLERWLKIGYQPAQLVIEPGTFSRRGGILDVFPVADSQPVRIEFFDDEIDSLRRFDPSTQRSTDRIQRAVITPAREAMPENTPPLAAHLADWFANLPMSESDTTSARADAQPLSLGTPFPFIEHYLPYLYANPVSLLDYAPADALIIVEDSDELRDSVAEIEAHAAKTREEMVATSQLAPDHPQPYLDWAALNTALEGRTTLHLAGTSQPDSEDFSAFSALFAPEERFGGQLKLLLSRLRTLKGIRERSIVVTQQAARLSEMWHEQEADSDGFTPTTKDLLEAPPPQALLFIDGALQEGWRLNTDKPTHLFTDAEIFGWSRPEPRRRTSANTRRARTPESAYTDWEAGDYVVHEDYGIGRFSGMRRRTIENVQREYLVVEYAGTDILFVPIHQADRLTRYVGPNDQPPSVTKLGQPDWTRITRKTRRAIQEEATELIELYAARASAPGHAFGTDTPWQHELEASFGYVETDDQLRAVREVKADMEQPHPMDRLICGDVGYGKTEVALRAAFKAVMDGKQVALLVPTTVLAQQHFETFSRRLAAFPMVVEMLSRFRTAAEQRKVLAKLASGEVDVIIGTHRLLQTDVSIPNLGLIIIDEEQRFGVKHKEHFKHLRTQVDVLTLTATPIPRTMFMGLTGVRDISLIQTPPEERLPVLTQVGPFDERIVRQSVMRELERGGQVFFVHNRVRSIAAARDKLMSIVPEASVVVAHGQMDERTLEDAMLRFGRGEADVLVCTSIIENGLDIPNANTLIIDHADWFGMAQLYQLRGRVGRSARQAYAYFFHLSEERLTEEARARLETLEENTHLGAGFQIAMRDLELRGAGDILSHRQTGHVAAVGLHLYTHMLADTIERLKNGIGTQQPDEAAEAADLEISVSNVTIDLPIAAFLPNDYIPEMSMRLQIYRRIANLSSAEEVDAMRAELQDRFGKLPQAVEGLLYQIDVKLLSQAAGAKAVIAHRNKTEIRLPYLPDVNREALEFKLGADVHVSRTAVELTMRPDTWRERLLQLLGQLAQRAQESVSTGL